MSESNGIDIDALIALVEKLKAAVADRWQEDTTNAEGVYCVHCNFCLRWKHFDTPGDFPHDDDCVVRLI